MFRGVASKTEFAALTKVLRLSVYSYLSALLEQSLLADSHVPLQFLKPSLSPKRYQQDSPMADQLDHSLCTILHVYARRLLTAHGTARPHLRELLLSFGRCRRLPDV